MLLSAQYRKFAEECLDLARDAKPAARETLLTMAAIWLDLASDAVTSALESYSNENRANENRAVV